MAHTKIDRETCFVGTQQELATLIGPYPRDVTVDRDVIILIVPEGATFEQRTSIIEQAIRLKHGYPMPATVTNN